MSLLDTITIVTRRREPVRDRNYSPSKRAEVPTGAGYVAPPPPTPYGAFFRVGRDARHTGETTDVTVDLAIADRLAVMGWPFGVPRVPSALVVGQPSGAQNPLPDRVNLASRGSIAHGDRATAAPPVSYSAIYAKLA